MEISEGKKKNDKNPEDKYAVEQFQMALIM